MGNGGGIFWVGGGVGGHFYGCVGVGGENEGIFWVGRGGLG